MGEREEAPRTTLFVPLLDTLLATSPPPPQAPPFFVCFFASPPCAFFSLQCLLCALVCILSFAACLACPWQEPQKRVLSTKTFFWALVEGERKMAVCVAAKGLYPAAYLGTLLCFVLFRLLNCCCLHLAFQWLLAPFEFASRTEENLARLCFLLAYGGSCSLLTKDCGRNAGAVALQFPATFWQCIHSCRFHLSSIVARDSFAHCTSFVAL